MKLILKINIVPKSNKFKLNLTHKRTMLTNTKQLIESSKTALSKKMLFHITPRQYYPGKFKAVYYDTKEQPTSGSGKSLPNHETFHTKVQEVTTGKIYGGFTSHPKAGDPNYQHISEERLDGSIDPTIGQWFGVYKHPKTVSSPEIVKEVPKSQAYIDKNESKFDAIAQSKKDTLCDDRTSRQDSRFYNENGTRDYDNFQGKW